MERAARRVLALRMAIRERRITEWVEKKEAKRARARERRSQSKKRNRKTRSDKKSLGIR